MNSDRAKWLVLCAAPGLLAGCVHEAAGVAPASTFGEANRQTMLMQVVEPDNLYDSPIPASAGKAAQAAERYRKDTVKKPDRVRSTSVSSGSSSSSGSGGNP